MQNTLKNNHNIQNKPQIDLVKLFYKENIDLEIFFGKSKRGASKVVQEFSLEPYNGELNSQQKSHLLRRSLIGLSNRHLDDINNLSFDDLFEKLFSEETLSEPTNNYYFNRTNEDWNEIYGRDDVAPGEKYINNASTQRNENGEYENGDWVRRECLQRHIAYNLYSQNTSVHWKLFMFLHNLVPTDGGQGIDNKGLWNYYKLIFDSCFNSYKDFIYNITINPAMLIYLNLTASQKDTPDENYAREVQELFTVGKRPFSMFTEEDVREAARLLVGFEVKWDSLYEEGEVTHVVHDWNHDTGDKQFSSFYGNKKILGRDTKEGMLEELREFVDMLFYPVQAKLYMARRLYQFFVNPLVSDEIESKVIRPLADIFENNNYNLAETLKVLLKSKHFFDEANYYSMIKSPYDHVIGLYKELNIFDGIIRNYNDEENGTFSIPERLSNLEVRKFYFGGPLSWRVSEMGMQLGFPPSVSGWPPYYQSPVYDMFWINSVTLSSKVQTVEEACKWGIWMDEGYSLRCDQLQYLLTYENNEDIDDLIDEMSVRLLCSAISSSDRQSIISYSFNGANKSHWTDLVQEYKKGNSNVEWEIESIFLPIMTRIFSLAQYNLF
jgi:hypothetical protein